MVDEKPQFTWAILTKSPGETRRVGQEFGRLLEPGDVVALIGGLGSGKTLFTQGLARGLQVPEGYYITSPTFVLVNEYPGRIPFYHLDLYRLEGPADFADLGLEEMLHGDGVAAIEWAERLGEDMPQERLELRLGFGGESERSLTFKAFGANWRKRLEALAALN
jgi:tRNA threonylcarbamoyladenosine biosynthesis protein TsaE